MKKALCFLLVILMMCPFHILAAEVDWLAPITPPEEAGEAPVEPQAEPPGEFLDVLQPETPVESPATSPEEAPGDFLDPSPADSSEPAQPDPEPAAGEEEDPTVQMKVPSSGQVIINPYGYSVKTNLGTTNEQVISTIQYLVSRSNVPISVSVEIVGTHSNPDARFVTGEPDPSAKDLFLYAEFQPVEEGEEPVWIGRYTGADCQVLINESKANTVTLPSGDDTPRKVAFRLFGSVSSGAGSGWTGNDSLSVTMSYKFDPLVEPETVDETDTEAQPETETPENPEEDAALTEEDGQDTEEEPEQADTLQPETEAPEETVEPKDEADLPEDEPLDIENEVHPDDYTETEHDRPSFHDEDDDPPAHDNENGIDWLDPSETDSEPDDYQPDANEEDPGADLESTDNGDSTIAWLKPSEEDEPDESEEAVPPQGEDETGNEPEPENQASDSSGIDWLLPSSPE